MIGWKWVPVEPTPRMLAAGVAAEANAPTHVQERLTLLAYRAMLDAAPPPALPQDAARAEPVATLHDDGYWTWRSADDRLRHDSQFAGWRMDVYAAPPALPPGAREAMRRAADALRLARPIMDDEAEVNAAINALRPWVGEGK